ncbi:hypothetical protein K5M36_16895 [Chromobacterium vaccinii]|nr:hypothetical protein [Chromobacterium vaccinii]
MKTVLAVTCFGLMLAGCATEQARRQTASGNAEYVVSDTSLEDVQGRVAGRCQLLGWQIVEQQKNYTVCSKAMSGSSGVFAQLMLGNGYSTSPEMKVRFVHTAVGSAIEVSAAAWIETQMAMGQVRKAPLTDAKTQNGLQDILDSLSRP